MVILLKYIIQSENAEKTLVMFLGFYLENVNNVKITYLNIYIVKDIVCFSAKALMKRGGKTGLASGEVSSPVSGSKLVNFGYAGVNCCAIV